MTLRTSARAGATALFTVGALALTAGPALAAAEVDFGVKISGTTIAADAYGKLGSVDIANLGTAKADKVEVLFDLSKVDDAKVNVVTEGCKISKEIATCTLDSAEIPAPGKSHWLPVPLVKQDGATGAAGKLTITVKVEGDTDAKNDSHTVDLTVGDNGVDLTVVADDVDTSLTSNGEVSTQLIQPGGVGMLYGFILNQGDVAADGLTVSVTLPKQVTFAAELQECALSNGDRTATCKLSDTTLLPLQDDTSEDLGLSALTFEAPVRVSAQATGPVTLKGGEFQAVALGEVEGNVSRRQKTAPSLPENFRAATQAEIAELDIDASDNTDSFAVKVGAPAGGTGGGAGDEDPTLPVTGPVAATAGGVGLAVLVGGGLLLAASRRRRVVLVTPNDGQ